MNNCGFPDGVTHQHVEACYQAGRRDAFAERTAETAQSPEGVALDRTAIRQRLSRTRRASIYGDLIAGPEVGRDWLTSLAETAREIVAERQREWENAVLQRCVETMPATGDCADFMSVVSTAMLALRTPPEPTAGGDPS